MKALQFLPLAGTTLGFLLGLIPSFISKQKLKRRTVKLFEFEIESLRTSLRRQIDNLEKYIADFQEEKLTTLSLVLLHRFEVVKPLDKAILIKHYEKRHSTLAIGYISSLYQMFGVVESDTMRLDAAYSGYHVELNRIADSYYDEMNYLKLSAIIEKDKLGGDVSKDPFLLKLWETALPANLSPTMSEMIEFAKGVHIKLLTDDVFRNTTHPMYKIVLEFTMRGAKIIRLYQGKKKEFINLLKMYLETFKQALTEISESN